MKVIAELGVAEDRIFLTGNGPNLAPTADPLRFRRDVSLPPDAPIVLFLGQKFRYKGLAPLLDATRIVWRSHPETHFVFVGPRTRFSKRLFDRGALDRRVIEIGAVDVQQKTDALAACTLLCLPSTQESFGGVFTEAWSFGKPVVGGDIPAVREVVEDGVDGYLVKPSARDIAEKIVHLLDNPGLASQLGQAGREKVAQHHSWKRVAERTRQAYHAVLNG